MNELHTGDGALSGDFVELADDEARVVGLG
jgi:hypothetical protein